MIWWYKINNYIHVFTGNVNPHELICHAFALITPYFLIKIMYIQEVHIIWSLIHILSCAVLSKTRKTCKITDHGTSHNPTSNKEFIPFLLQVCNWFHCKVAIFRKLSDSFAGTPYFPWIHLSMCAYLHFLTQSISHISIILNLRFFYNNSTIKENHIKTKISAVHHFFAYTLHALTTDILNKTWKNPYKKIRIGNIFTLYWYAIGRKLYGTFYTYHFTSKRESKPK